MGSNGLDSSSGTNMGYRLFFLGTNRTKRREISRDSFSLNTNANEV